MADIYAAIPVKDTYSLSKLLAARIQELEFKLSSLRHNQITRRQRVEIELAELNRAYKIIQDAQDSQITNLTERLDKK